jgi:hypothetical protein
MTNQTVQHCFCLWSLKLRRGLTSGLLETAQQSLSEFSWRMTLQFLHHKVNNKKYNKQMSVVPYFLQTKCLSIPFPSKVISVKLKGGQEAS